MTQQVCSEVLVHPAVDVFENESAYVLTIEVPGATKDDVDLTLEKGVLSISATASSSVPEGYERVSGDCSARRFQRSFRLSQDVDHSGIDASVKDGLLTINLPKSVAAKSHKLEVKEG